MKSIIVKTLLSEISEPMFEGYYADTCTGKFPLVSMGGRAECPVCADTGARTPIGASGILLFIYIIIFGGTILYT